MFIIDINSAYNIHWSELSSGAMAALPAFFSNAWSQILGASPESKEERAVAAKHKRGASWQTDIETVVDEDEQSVMHKLDKSAAGIGLGTTCFQEEPSAVNQHDDAPFIDNIDAKEDVLSSHGDGRIILHLMRHAEVSQKKVISLLPCAWSYETETVYSY